MRASISTRIFLAFSLVIVIFCLVSIYSVFKIHRIHGNLGLIKSGYVRLVLTLTEVDSELRSYDVVLDERDPDLLTRSIRLTSVLHPFPALIRRHLGEASRVARGAAQSERIEPAEQVGLVELQRQLATLIARMDGVEALSGELSLAVTERDFERAADVQRRLKSESRSLRREVKRLMLALRSAIDDSVLRAERAETSSFWVVVALSIIAVLLSVVVTFFAGMALEPIRRLTDAVKRVSAGGELGRVEIRGNDELSLLAAEFNRMVEALRQRDAELRRSERLATIGRMSAQVAHEVRNPLQSIGLNSELLEEELAARPDAAEHPEALELLRSIQEEVERLTGVTEDYLRLARLPSPDLQPEDVNEVVLRLLEFLSGELDHAGIVLRTELAPGLPAVLADEHQLRQALLNLVRNSREAMDGGGELRVSTAREGDHVRIGVADTGGGIPGPALPNIYEPFFSTKEGGTGLGLALARAVVEAHHGTIECRSTPGVGTEFLLRLPLAGGGETP
ncbi:MAG: ATP-binding protein [Myxococcota bacterium]|jgi:signal transduction histidine kinase|nr:ATP-binding protein [Myxococcota bacterium]